MEGANYTMSTARPLHTIGLVFALLATAGTIQAATYTVNTFTDTTGTSTGGGSGSGTGTTGDLRYAILQANSNSGSSIYGLEETGEKSVNRSGSNGPLLAAFLTTTVRPVAPADLL